MAPSLRTRTAALAAALLLAPAAFAGETCVDARVGIDAAHHAISMQLVLPPGVQSLALAPFDGYPRGELLHSPDASATVSDDELRATQPGGRMTLALDVRDNLPQRDRAYAPFLRFADGTVALDSEFLAPADGVPPLCLRFAPAQGEKVVGFGEVADHELRAPGDGRSGGYVAFGDPRIDAGGMPLKAFDRSVPDWAARHLDDTLDRVVAYYRRWLPPVALPTAFVYRMPYPPGIGGNGSHGDRLPQSLTLGLLGDWSEPQDEALLPLDAFLGHEVFHLWNAANGMAPVDTRAMLAQEGGADLAGMFAAAELHGGGEAEWLDAATDALDTCLAALPDSGRLADAELAHGRLPYDCGAPTMLALAAANDRDDPAAGYFLAWKRVVERGFAEPDLHYRWDALADADADPRVLAAMRGAIDGEAAFPEAIRNALTLAGFALVPNDRLSPPLRNRLNQQLVGALMARDCDGVVDLWSEPDGYRVGDHAGDCHALQPKRVIVALMDMPLASDDPTALRAAIAARCDAGVKVQANYADGGMAELACPAELPRIPALWRIAAH
ncbi:MAG TPA: hypothetical protein VFI26_05340 [Lysobacter sp.]|nr:hypothetical protein [Lysobacter sp.]